MAGVPSGMATPGWMAQTRVLRACVRHCQPQEHLGGLFKTQIPRAASRSWGRGSWAWGLEICMSKKPSGEPCRH